MIPKVIHYCWLSGDSYPQKIQYCIQSWKKALPDYEFILWDTKRFPLDQSIWVKEAFETKKYAFAADYIRLYAVYHYGGIYLDCDVEVFKKFDDLLHLPYFIGKEAYDVLIEPAVLGAEKGLPWLKVCLDYYEGRHFIKEDGTFDIRVMPNILREILSSKYQLKNITSIKDFIPDENILNIFPNDWFCAHIASSPYEVKRTYIISNKTYCVHHFANSWIKNGKLKKKFWDILSTLRLYNLYINLRQIGVKKK